MPVADGPYVRQRGLSRLARRSAPRRRRARRRSTTSISTSTARARPPTRASSPASISRASTSAAGSTPAISTSAPRPNMRWSARWSTSGRRIGPTRDKTLIDQARRRVEMHVPDGTPDIAPADRAWHAPARRAVRRGRPCHPRHRRARRRANIPISATPRSKTDGLIYDPALKPGEERAAAAARPTTAGSSPAESSALNYGSIAALAAASRALRGHDDALAAKSLAHRAAGLGRGAQPRARHLQPRQHHRRAARDRGIHRRGRAAAHDRRPRNMPTGSRRCGRRSPSASPIAPTGACGRCRTCRRPSARRSRRRRARACGARPPEPAPIPMACRSPRAAGPATAR